MHLRLNRLAPCSAMLFLFGAAYTASAATNDAQKVVDQVMDLSGTNDMIDTIPEMVDAQMSGQLGQIGGEDAALFRDVMRAAFDPRQLRSAVAAVLLENYDETNAKSALKWYRSALGGKIRDVEARAQSVEGQAQLVEFAQGLQTTPPSRSRVEFVQRLDSAARSSELGLEILMAMMRGMMSGLAALGSDDSPTAANVDALLESQMRQMAPMIKNQTLVSLLFSSQSLTDAERSAYLAYVESDGGRWLYEQIGAGFIKAMSRAGEALATHMAAMVEDKRWSFSQEAAKQSYESTIAEGRAFGASTKQSACTDEAFRRRDACRDMACAANAEIFLEGCLETSQNEASLCAAAPSDKDLMATIYWRLRRCEERGTSTSACNRLMGVIQEYCASPRVGA